MPSRFSVLPRNLPLSQIQKFIPKKWRSVTESDPRNSVQPLPCSSRESVSGSCEATSESMVDCLLTTLKDFASQGHICKAFRTFSLIRTHVSSQTPCDLVIQSLSSLLLCCTNSKSLPEGKQIHACIINSGIAHSWNLVPRIITFYTTFSLLDNAHAIAETSNILHPLPWNLLISSYVRRGQNEKAFSAYRQMVNRGIRPDEFTYPSVLKACGEQLNLAFGRDIHKSIDASFLEGSLFVQNALVSMYAKCGEVDVAHDIFERMPVKDAVSWNSMISGYASKGMWSKAFELFDRMRATGAEMDIITWNTIAGGCLKTGNFIGALKLFSQMRTCGIQLEPVATLIGLGACSHTGLLKNGKEIHGLVIRSHLDDFDNVRNALINMYARCKALKQAHILFQLVDSKTVITWNTIISGFAHWDRFEETSFLFREMLFSGVEPNYITIASILPLCARVANLQHGKEFHCYLTRRDGFEEHLLLWNSLVDMYARSGKVVVARKLFNLMSKKDAVTYTSLIAGYGIQGEGREAIELFNEMIRHHIKPDHVTMVAALSACSHSGHVTQGQKLFEQMQSTYDISPRLEHFSCLIDLFGRAGLLKKAEEIIIKMPYEPTPEMWATLLGACKIHRNTEIGEWAAEKLLELRPDNPGYYVLIANMYADAGRWNKLAKVRTVMRDFGVRKAPGCAWVDTGSGFSPFLVSDTSSGQTNEIYCLLGGLNRQMKDTDYVTTEDSSSEEELCEGLLL
ncbi:pentatricopeptide repeat-containing protein At1g71490 [Nicotiana tabacum]|uniref:Pentatricopeptide repeat-containing protein At1g71490 n=7 Tax=Nicotiana tabacum TaxID=4097 RepID=A0A1S3ZVK3_TOBAC